MRLFSFDMGEVEEERVVLGEDIKQVKHGGGDGCGRAGWAAQGPGQAWIM